VDAIDLRVAQGEIYGYLGLNGAGKSTTIRILLGMVTPTSGSVELFGQRVHADARTLWRRVGHLVESATAYPELSVRENLEVAAHLAGIPANPSLGRIIDRLALGLYADRRAGALSLGSLQRLALARALLHAPDLLVLDEPANGLDAAGVHWLRGFLRQFAAAGGTVLVSSHLLAEVAQSVDQAMIIDRGRLVATLEMAELADANSLEQLYLELTGRDES
jgi:ABC-2 type transport system ATP-binding protein